MKMGKVKKRIIWIIACIAVVLAMGATTANISKADNVTQRKVVDNSNNENDSSLEDEDSDDKSEDETDKKDKDEDNNDKDNKEETDFDLEDDESGDKDVDEDSEEEEVDKDQNDDLEETDDTEEDEEYEEEMEDFDYTSIGDDLEEDVEDEKSSYQLFTGDGLHVIGQIYPDKNNQFNFDGKWFALEDNQFVYASEVSQKDNVTEYKALVLIEEKEAYIYFQADKSKKITVLGYQYVDDNATAIIDIDANLKLTPIYMYLNIEKGETDKRYGSETVAGENVIVTKKIKKWSYALKEVDNGKVTYKKQDNAE